MDVTKTQITKTLLAAANEDGAAADLLFIAGLQAGKGVYTEQNFALAISLLERAWLAGEPRAAGRLSSFYSKLKDPHNAYPGPSAASANAAIASSSMTFCRSSIPKESYLSSQQQLIRT